MPPCPYHHHRLDLPREIRYLCNRPTVVQYQGYRRGGRGLHHMQPLQSLQSLHYAL